MLRKTAFLLVVVIILGYLGSCKTANEANTEESLPAVISATQASELQVVVYYVKHEGTPYLVREVHPAVDSGDSVVTAVQEQLHGVPTTPGAQTVFPRSLSCLKCDYADGTAQITLTKDLLLSEEDHTVLALAVTGLVNTLTEYKAIDRVRLKVDDVSETDVETWLISLGFPGQPLTRDMTIVLEPPIWVERPVPNAVITSPVSVRGSAIEDIVEFRLTTEAGEILAETMVEMPDGTSGRGPFTTDIVYTHSASGRGLLEVFQTDPARGQENDKVIIPVTFGGSGQRAGGP